jgi:hypothetical protein
VSLGGFSGSRVYRTIPVCFDFIAISLSRRDDTDPLRPQGVNDDYFKSIDESCRHEAAFAIVFAVIHSLDTVFIQKNPGGKRERNAMLPEIRGGLSRVPLEFHRLMLLHL